MQTLQNVKVGNSLSQEVANVEQPHCRTRKQWEAIITHHKNNPSAWWLSNPFTEGRKCNSYFMHHYMDVEGRICAALVHTNGEIEYVVKGNASYKKEVETVLDQYGSFQGK